MLQTSYHHKYFSLFLVCFKYWLIVQVPLQTAIITCLHRYFGPTFFGYFFAITIHPFQRSLIAGAAPLLPTELRIFYNYTCCKPSSLLFAKDYTSLAVKYTITIDKRSTNSWGKLPMLLPLSKIVPEIICAPCMRASDVEVLHAVLTFSSVQI